MSPGRRSADDGLDWAHRKRRAAALEALEEGEPCPLCNQPMYSWQVLDLDHATPRVLGGDGRFDSRLAHGSCNRSAGASLGNRLRGARRRGVAPARLANPRTSRDW